VDIIEAHYGGEEGREEAVLVRRRDNIENQIK
jgi:hypothetical protein